MKNKATVLAVFFASLAAFAFAALAFANNVSVIVRWWCAFAAADGDTAKIPTHVSGVLPAFDWAAVDYSAVTTFIPLVGFACLVVASLRLLAGHRLRAGDFPFFRGSDQLNVALGLFGTLWGIIVIGYFQLDTVTMADLMQCLHTALFSTLMAVVWVFLFDRPLVRPFFTRILMRSGLAETDDGDLSAAVDRLIERLGAASDAFDRREAAYEAAFEKRLADYEKAFDMRQKEYAEFFARRIAELEKRAENSESRLAAVAAALHGGRAALCRGREQPDGRDGARPSQVLVLLFALLGASTQAATTTRNGYTLTYTVENKQVTISQIKPTTTTSAEETLTIPATINGNAVVKLYKENACPFVDCTKLETIVIAPASLTLYERTFSACSALTNFVSTSANYATEDGALYDAAKETLIRVPTARQDIAIAAMATTIRSLAFAYTAVTNVHLPTAVATIGYNAFPHATALASFSVDSANAVYSARAGVLYDKAGTSIVRCPATLAEWRVPYGVTNVCGYAFYDATALAKLTFTRTLRNIKANAFSGMPSSAYVYFEGDVPTIDAGWDMPAATIRIRYNARYADNWVAALAKLATFPYRDSYVPAERGFQLLFLSNATTDATERVPPVSSVYAFVPGGPRSVAAAN